MEGIEITDNKNLSIYDSVRVVPDEAKKPILAGRLKGRTDINPMWRIKCLTEQFGVCGVGWKYSITKQWLEKGGGHEVAAFVNIDLHIKVDGQWSEAIPGTGGNSFIANEKNGLYTSDECFKMALTDAISVACKALGVGADVYWENDITKNDANQNRINSEPTISDKRVAVENYLNANIQVLQQTLKHLNIGEIGDATENQIRSMYDTLKHKKKI